MTPNASTKKLAANRTSYVSLALVSCLEPAIAGLSASALCREPVTASVLAELALYPEPVIGLRPLAELMPEWALELCRSAAPRDWKAAKGSPEQASPERTSSTSWYSRSHSHYWRCSPDYHARTSHRTLRVSTPM